MREARRTFFEKKTADQIAPRGRPARRAGLALMRCLFRAKRRETFLRKRPPTKLLPEVGRRVEQGWPYHFLCRRAADQTGPQRSTGAWSRGGLTISCAGGPPTKPGPRDRPAPRAEAGLTISCRRNWSPNLDAEGKGREGKEREGKGKEREGEGGEGITGRERQAA